MKFQRRSIKENLQTRAQFQFLGEPRWVCWLMAVFFSVLVANAEPVWREIPLDSLSKATPSDFSDAMFPATVGLVAALDDQTQCRVGHQPGAKGVVVMSDAGLDRQLLTLWWDIDGKLIATVRAADSVPLESFTLREGKQTELILLRRGTVIYAYAVDSGKMDPLIAVDFATGSGCLAGALFDKNSEKERPAISPLLASSTLTGDLLQKQAGTRLNGNWTSEGDIECMGGSHLLNSGDDAKASVAVTIENLLPGTHELWFRHSADKFRTAEAEITVEGLGAPVSLLVNQQISGGLWLPLGRFETESVTSAMIRLIPGHPDTGSLSMDAVHVVSFLWRTNDQGLLLDGLASAKDKEALVTGAASLSSTVGASGQEDPNRRGSSNQAATDLNSVSSDNRAVVFVHQSMGNDSFDGRLEKPQASAWFSVRGGPKRTIEAALKSISKTTRVIELHLDGKLEPPVGGFQDLGNVAIVLVPGKNGTSFESSDLAPVLPPPSQPMFPR